MPRVSLRGVTRPGLLVMLIPSLRGRTTAALVRSAVVCAAALLALVLCIPARGEVPVPELRSRVTDLTGTLDPVQVRTLEEQLREFEARKGSQIAVLLVPTTEPEAIEQFGIRVVEAWKLGRKGIDDGALLLIAKQDRSLRIEVGYGLEGVIPDAVANRVIDEVITPYFKRGDFYGGISAGVDRITRLIDGEPLPPPRQEPTSGIAELLPFLFIPALVAGQIVRLLFGRLLGALIMGALVGGAIWWLIGSLLGALVGAAVAFFIVFTQDQVPGGYPRRGRYGGMGSGVEGGGRSGGGGFSGGGGGFGGGGASGRW